MSQSKQTNNEPSYDELENLFINNNKLDRIEAYLNKFNPIKIMKMQHMEIRHSAILAWLLDPIETHGLGDSFLRMFLAEALKGQGESKLPTALDISQADLRDSEIRCEWQNIDIFIFSQSNNWAFIIENKFYSKQRENQLEKYRKKVEEIYKAEKIKIRGIFLALLDEEPEDESYAPINYNAICEILKHLINQHENQLSVEISTFLNHYLQILEEATGMSEERNEMEELARQLYKSHKKVLDFVIEHGASTDFALAARALFGENPEKFNEVTIGDSEYVFDKLSNRYVSFLPLSWYKAFGKQKYEWEGCENFWAGYPLILWSYIDRNIEGTGGILRLFAEVGSISNYEFRRELIEAIIKVTNSKHVVFRAGAKNEKAKYSKFLKGNTLKIKDIHDVEEIIKGMEELLTEFKGEFEEISKILPDFTNYGISKNNV